MLAFAWPWDEAGHDRQKGLSRRLAGSLCAGIGGHAGAAEIDGGHFAFRPQRLSAASSRAWRPAVLPSGRIVVFHGYIDNAAALAPELGTDCDDLGRLYGLAYERWSEQADLRVIGEYCALVVEPDRRAVRLSRTPIRAPPLYYYHNPQLVAAASVPRALFAAGVGQRLNEVKLADAALYNCHDREESWFHDIAQVPMGCTVELQRGRPRRLRQYYDVLALPQVRMQSDGDYIARASELLDEGVRACLAGFGKPGATLSAGLDTPQIAVRALAALPPDQPLPTFTFHPEDGYDGRVEPGAVGDERPFVEAFAAMHPRIEPHFTANEGYEHDHRCTEFFHLIGAAPPPLTNMYLFHGLFAQAAKQGCDVLLLAEWGNVTFSDKGSWGFVDYLVKGRWRQLWLALTRLPNERRSLLGRFLVRCALPFLPNRLWRVARRWAMPRQPFLIDLAQPLSAGYRLASGADQRLKDCGKIFERYQPRSRRHALKLLFENDDYGMNDIYQGFEQMYGVAQRDPTTYRPFLEYCFGLPTHLFLRDGEPRWLAKQMAKGIMPEAQRANRLQGRWDADWHLRIGRRRKEYLEELERLSRDERIASIIDIPRLRHSLEDWPEHTELDRRQSVPRQYAVTRGLLTARFVSYVEGRNIR